MENFLVLPVVLRRSLLAFAFFGIAGAQMTTGSSGNATSNNTIPAPKRTSVAPLNCCFLVQDTVSEVWWEQYSTRSAVSLVNLTSYTYYVTPMPTTTVTSTKTEVIETNATFYVTVGNGRNPLTLFENSSPGPYQATSRLLGINTTQIVTAGVTIQSPAAYYIYSTVKVITAAPITLDGQLACGTQAIYKPYSITLDHVNSNAESYWGTKVQPSSKIPTSTELLTETGTVNQPGTKSTYTQTQTFTEYSTKFSAFPSGVTTISFDPYVYAPEYAKTGLRGVGETTCDDDEGRSEVRFGFLPEQLLKYMVGVPEISSQYPGLESCFAGGPVIVTQTKCEATAGELQIPGGDLTSSKFITVNPTDGPITSQQSSASTSTTSSPVPVKTSETVTPSTSTSISTKKQPTSISLTPVTETATPTLATPTTQSTSTSVSEPPSQTTAIVIPIPISSTITTTPTTTTATTTSSDGSIASAIASLIGIPPPETPTTTTTTASVSTSITVSSQTPTSRTQGHSRQAR
ncbi:hypothetical protein GLAREA_05151 [Glarea lozoyensis ATCC 20868]|uniref:Uncharacterized protein n=1 Tax=Glarea lozoyensis (strain ATCC 20868 / MF5171) TaxID=1116229 RepID=S3EC02_GLAL2|nr:uncharacterized protein GLAREA_05151 [Glarea lozoyensis ATCC 20868]EPE35813.1 hypothetical protein GLAREA_05151 [Glarea lozoyensis ATCC 20868]